MDRADRLISNREQTSLLLAAAVIALLAAGAAWLVSGGLTEGIVQAELGRLLQLETVQPLSDYGYHEGMELSLLPGYGNIRMTLFLAMAGSALAVVMLLTAAALANADRAIIRLETLQSDCIRIAEQKQEEVSLQGTDFSSMRRVCMGVNLVARRMRHLSDTLEEEKQFLKEFLTDFSHQVKNSLAAVRLSSDMLCSLEQLSTVQREALCEELDVQLGELEALAVSALRLARLNADAVLYEKQMQPLSETCRMALDRVRPLLRQHQITAELTQGEDVTLLHDRLWLAEAIQNILSNAACHADCTEVVLSAEQLPGAVRITVQDNGKGIPQEEIPRLFGRFSLKRGSASMQNAGVGLAVAKKIIEAHDGSVSVFSGDGEGTRFDILFLTTQ